MAALDYQRVLRPRFLLIYHNLGENRVTSHYTSNCISHDILHTYYNPVNFHIDIDVEAPPQSFSDRETIFLSINSNK